MKRENENEDLYFKGVLLLEKARKIEVNYQGPVFVIVRGVELGFFKTFDEVKAVGGHDKNSVYKKFRNRQEGVNWYNSCIARPSIFRKQNSINIQIAFLYYDVTQERDYGSAATMYFKEGDKRNFTKPTNMNASHADAACLIFLEIFKYNIGSLINVLTNSKRLAYGINYGLWNWPKHDIVSPPTALCEKCYQICIEKNVAIDWYEGRALEQCHSMCRRVSNDHTLFKKYKAIEQALTWMMCAKQLNICKDVARIIGKIVRRAKVPKEGLLF